jgi:hypothetical protein
MTFLTMLIELYPGTTLPTPASYVNGCGPPLAGNKNPFHKLAFDKMLEKMTNHWLVSAPNAFLVSSQI